MSDPIQPWQVQRRDWRRSKRGGEVRSMKKETLVRKNIKPEPDITTMADEGLSMQKARWGNDQQVRNRMCSQRLIGSPGHNMQITGNLFMWEENRKWESDKRRRKIGEIWLETARPWHPQRVKSHILIVNNSSWLKTAVPFKNNLSLKWNWAFPTLPVGRGVLLMTH